MKIIIYLRIINLFNLLNIYTVLFIKFIFILASPFLCNLYTLFYTMLIAFTYINIQEGSNAATSPYIFVVY